MNSINKTVRIAGFLYFIYMVFHIFADVIGRSKLFVYGDAAATAQNIIASGWQFRIAIMMLFVFQFFLFPGFVGITYVSFALGLIAEVGLTFWLLIMGVKDQEPTLADGRK